MGDNVKSQSSVLRHLSSKSMKRSSDHKPVGFTLSAPLTAGVQVDAKHGAGARQPALHPAAPVATLATYRRKEMSGHRASKIVPVSVQRQGPIRLTLAKLGGLRPSPPFRKRAEASLMEVLPAEPVVTKVRQAGVQSL